MLKAELTKILIPSELQACNPTCGESDVWHGFNMMNAYLEKKKLCTYALPYDNKFVAIKKVIGVDTFLIITGPYAGIITDESGMVLRRPLRVAPWSGYHVDQHTLQTSFEDEFSISQFSGDWFLQGMLKLLAADIFEGGVKPDIAIIQENMREYAKM
ncbi:MAG: hypothetical protein WAV40_03645 [Microgenomates group bacterium]